MKEGSIMKSKSISAFVVGAAMLGLGNITMAAKSETVDVGKQEYLNKCAVCHGRSGKATDVGPIMDVLKKAPSDLTTLSKRNGGVFPVERIRNVIDGREAIAAHGERDMPVWGKAYNAETVEAAEHFFDIPYDIEMYTRVRIAALIDYLNRIQAK